MTRVGSADRLLSSQDPPARHANLAPSGVVAPSWDDPVARQATGILGGSLGRRVRLTKGWLTPMRALVLVWLLASVVAMGLKLPCYSQGWGDSTTHSTDDQHYREQLHYQYIRQCYSNIAWVGAMSMQEPGWFFTPTNTGEAKTADAAVLTSLVKDATAWLSPRSESVVTDKQFYFAVNAVMLLGCFLVIVCVVAYLSGRRRWDAALVALAPGMLLAGLVSFDLWAVMATTLALWAWSRRRTVWAGVAFGIAVCFSFYPLVVVFPLLVLCWRAGQTRHGLTSLASAVVTWLVVNGPAMMAAPTSWSQFYSQWFEQGAGLGSLWFAGQLQQWDLASQGPRLTLMSLGLLLAGLALLGLLVLMTPRKPRVAQVAFLAVALLVLTSKSYAVQHVVWLVPLTVLARPRWRDFLIWQLSEVVYFVAVWLYLTATVAEDGANRALGDDAYSLAIVIHVVGLLWVMAVVVRDMLHPSADPVREGQADDPAGGVLDQEYVVAQARLAAQLEEAQSRERRRQAALV